MEEQNHKFAQSLFDKILECSQIMGIHGTITRDMQLLFISETIRVVLESSQDFETAMCLRKHIQDYIYEKDVIEGKKTTAQHLVERLDESPKS